MSGHLQSIYARRVFSRSPVKKINKWVRAGNRAFVIATILCSGLPGVSLAEDYKIGAQDKLRIKVVEWRAGKGEYYEWSGINGEYLVGASGTLQIPLLGQLTAAGRSPAQLADEIATGLQERVGMINRPDASVQIAEFRPIFVVGDVEKPGEYAFRPGINVLQAVSLAGGLRKVTDAGLLRLERDRITAQGSMEASQIELRRAYAKRARLQAELTGRNDVEPPHELQGDPEIEQLMSGEKELFGARKEAVRAQREVLKNLKDLLTAEVESLTKKIEVQMKQMLLARQELAAVGSLVQKGLAVSSREFNLERTAAEIESRLLDFQTAALRARQGINEATQKEVDLENNRRREIMIDLQQVEAIIEQSSSKIRTAKGLLNEAAVTAPLLAAERRHLESFQPTYGIIRRKDSQTRETPAEEFSPMIPGDAVRVTLPRPSDDTGAPSDRSSNKLTSKQAASTP